MTEDMERFRDAIENKLATLNGKVEGACFICGETVNYWGVVVPDGDADALGFGSKDENTARVAFFPVCKEHDVEDITNKAKIRDALILKKKMMSN